MGKRQVFACHINRDSIGQQQKKNQYYPINCIQTRRNISVCVSCVKITFMPFVQSIILSSPIWSDVTEYFVYLNFFITKDVKDYYAKVFLRIRILIFVITICIICEASLPQQWQAVNRMHVCAALLSTNSWRTSEKL